MFQFLCSSPEDNYVAFLFIWKRTITKGKENPRALNPTRVAKRRGLFFV